MTLSRLKKRILLYPEKKLTTHSQSLGALRYHADKVELSGEFAFFIIRKVMDRNGLKTLDRSIVCFFVRFVKRGYNKRQRRIFKFMELRKKPLIMKENKLEKLPLDYIKYIKENVGLQKYIKEQALYYCKNACHVNSILFAEFVNSTTKYHCSIIEGMVVCSNGLAYEHYWNLIRNDNGDTEYVDVTMDAIATDAEREVEKKYYEIKEHEMNELIQKIANKQSLFSKEVHQAIDEYYVEHPEREAEYRKVKQVVDENIVTG